MGFTAAHGSQKAEAHDMRQRALRGVPYFLELVDGEDAPACSAWSVSSGRPLARRSDTSARTSSRRSASRRARAGIRWAYAGAYS